MISEKIIDFYVLIVGGFLIVFSILILLNPQKINKKANFFFGLFFIGLSFYFVPEILIKISVQISKPIIRFLIIFFQLFVIFFFYYGVRYLTNPIFSIKKNLNFYIVFFILFSISVYTSLTYKYTNDGFENLDLFFEIIYVLNIILYTVLSFKTVKKHQKVIIKYRSNLEENDLKWVEMICYFLFIILTLHSFKIFFSHYNKHFDLMVYFVPVFFIGILFIAYHIIKQKEIYTIKEATVYNLDNEKDFFAKKEIIELNKLPEFKTLITNFFENEKPYLDSELNLIKTAEFLQLSTHQVSFILNEGFKENFSQFVNRYRIEQAKNLICNPEMNHLSILGIGFEVGFNSKTVFNTTFKKNTGKTPTEFKKSHNSFIESGSVL